MGLLLMHKRTVTLYADMMSLSQPGAGGGSKGGKRDVIKGFSNASRYRLFRLFHSLRFERFAFVTLTYGDKFPDDARDAKKHLKAYRRAFERRWGAVPAVWRMERQDRGAPHFHILYLDPPFIPVQDWETVWHKARGDYGLEQTRNSVDLKVPNKAATADVVSKYLGKYICKPLDGDDEEDTRQDGRLWGRWNIETPEPETIEITDWEAEWLNKRLLPGPEGPGFHPADMYNYTLFGTTMGREDFRKMVHRELESIKKVTRKFDNQKVTNGT